MADHTLLQRVQERHGIPGWVDLQVNGTHGISFCDPSLTLDRVIEATEKIVASGTSRYLATVITSPPEVTRHCLRVLGEACNDRTISEHLLGIHLEGPFLSPDVGARGAHPPEFMQLPNLELFQQFQEAANGHIRLLTLAPELPGAFALIEKISDSVTCCSGHTLAGYTEHWEAVSAGLKLGTHIGNGIPSQLDRHDNPVIAQLAISELVCSFIPDGFHLPPGFIRAVLEAKGTDGCFVVSDQTHVAGMPPGEYSFGTTPAVLEDNGFLHMRDGPYLAGSSRTMAQCMEHLDSLSALDDLNLVKLGYEIPLTVIAAR